MGVLSERRGSDVAFLDDAALGPVCVYQKGTIVLRQNERPRSLFLVVTGCVALTAAERDGAEIVVGVRTAGWL